MPTATRTFMSSWQLHFSIAACLMLSSIPVDLTSPSLIPVDLGITSPSPAWSHLVQCLLSTTNLLCFLLKQGSWKSCWVHINGKHGPTPLAPFTQQQRNWWLLCSRPYKWQAWPYASSAVTQQQRNLWLLCSCPYKWQAWPYASSAVTQQQRNWWLLCSHPYKW
jgi:hypothetical protein